MFKPPVWVLLCKRAPSVTWVATWVTEWATLCRLSQERKTVKAVDIYHQGHYCLPSTLEASPINKTITTNSVTGISVHPETGFQNKQTNEQKSHSENMTSHHQLLWLTWSAREREGPQASLLMLSAWLLLQI